MARQFICLITLSLHSLHKHLWLHDQPRRPPRPDPCRFPTRLDCRGGYAPRYNGRSGGEYRGGRDGLDRYSPGRYSPRGRSRSRSRSRSPVRQRSRSPVRRGLAARPRAAALALLLSQPPAFATPPDLS